MVFGNLANETAQRQPPRPVTGLLFSPPRVWALGELACDCLQEF